MQMFLLLYFVYAVIIETQTIYRKPHLQVRKPNRNSTFSGVSLNGL